jgi:hypothetical protein
MTSLETVCRGIYAKTRAFGPIASLRRKKKMGFEILLGPPFKHAPIAFIGYQPGDWKLSPAEARRKGYEHSWVTNECQFATEGWVLARRLREIFRKDVLQQCVGLNAVFLRARNVREYEAKVGLRDRRSIEQFCRVQVKALLDAIDPLTIVAIGHGTLDLFGNAHPVLKNNRGQALVKSGKIFERPAYSVLHLSGARIRREDRQEIARYLRIVTGTAPASLAASPA